MGRNTHLAINRYKEVAYGGVEYEPPIDLLKRLRGIQAEIDDDLTSLEELLR